MGVPERAPSAPRSSAAFRPTGRREVHAGRDRRRRTRRRPAVRRPRAAHHVHLPRRERDQRSRGRRRDPPLPGGPGSGRRGGARHRDLGQGHPPRVRPGAGPGPGELQSAGTGCRRTIELGLDRHGVESVRGWDAGRLPRRVERDLERRTVPAGVPAPNGRGHHQLAVGGERGCEARIALHPAGQGGISRAEGDRRAGTIGRGRELPSALPPDARGTIRSPHPTRGHRHPRHRSDRTDRFVRPRARDGRGRVRGPDAVRHPAGRSVHVRRSGQTHPEPDRLRAGLVSLVHAPPGREAIQRVVRPRNLFSRGPLHSAR